MNNIKKQDLKRHWALKIALYRSTSTDISKKTLMHTQTHTYTHTYKHTYTNTHTYEETKKNVSSYTYFVYEETKQKTQPS